MVVDSSLGLRSIMNLFLELCLTYETKNKSSTDGYRELDGSKAIMRLRQGTNKHLSIC